MQLQNSTRGILKKQEREWLCANLQAILLPKFVSLGFYQVALSKDDKKALDIRAAFPFGRFFRERGNVIDLVEIQLDRHGKPMFRLSFGCFPSDGINHKVGHVNKEDVWVHYLPCYFAAYRAPFFRIWFSLLFHWFSKTSPSDFECLVKKTASVAEEIDSALRLNIFGKHIRKIQ